MPTDKPRDHRWSDRKVLSLPVEFRFSGALFTGTTRDIGFGGCFLESEAQFVKDDVVNLVINVGQRYCISAIVIWTTAEGAGLMFTETSHIALREIRQVLLVSEAVPMVHDIPAYTGRST